MNIHDKNFFYQDAAESVVDSIISLFNQGIKDFESYDIWPYDIAISSEAEDYRHFNWRYDVCRAESDDVDFVYDFFGLAGRDCYDEPSINITIVLPKRKHQKKVVINRAELFDVVTHEMHHLAQNIENNSFDRRPKEDGKLSYFLDPFEIEAFHVGIRAHSALSGRSFDDIAREYITKSWAEGTLKEIEKVIKAWKSTDFGAFENNYRQNSTNHKLRGV